MAAEAFIRHVNAGSLSPAQLQRLMKHSAFTTTRGDIDDAKVMTERPDVYVPEVLKKKNGEGSARKAPRYR